MDPSIGCIKIMVALIAVRKYKLLKCAFLTCSSPNKQLNEMLPVSLAFFISPWRQITVKSDTDAAGSDEVNLCPCALENKGHGKCWLLLLFMIIIIFFFF